MREAETGALKAYMLPKQRAQSSASCILVAWINSAPPFGSQIAISNKKHLRKIKTHVFLRTIT
ncbi:hypothetical protein A6X20_40095 [Bradyrhizobium elkanii]|nr:hypothetical protein A6X20_40095 [Bradyrhizobium elkanii]ODM72926.1 hypothetical protein A6452_41115 [Bradyrhizobium elkanii]